jgi:predicted GNAT family N-acyltransferase
LSAPDGLHSRRRAGCLSVSFRPDSAIRSRHSRVLTTKAARGSGAGKTRCCNKAFSICQHYPGQDIQIGAQLYLDKFYHSFGFEPVSAVYLEDGIEHQDMLRRADT